MKYMYRYENFFSKIMLRLLEIYSFPLTINMLSRFVKANEEYTNHTHTNIQVNLNPTFKGEEFYKVSSARRSPAGSYLEYRSTVHSFSSSL